MTATALPPLYVDLDGTLIATDLLHESALRLLRASPRDAFRIPGWLMKGKAFLKHELAQRVRIDVASLPYRQAVLDLIRRERASGRRVVLATAADSTFASAVAAHVGLFDEVLASNGTSNLSGRNKLDAIRIDTDSQPFHYAGDGVVDLAVWRGAEAAVVVSSSTTLRPRVSAVTRVDAVVDVPRATLRDYLYGMRLHQWLKNLLVFVPLLPVLGSASPAMLISALWMLLAFGLCASSVYIFNDLLDLEADRQHHRKRLRPFASGVISISRALVMAFSLLGLAVVVAAATLPVLAQLALAGYALLTLVYSVWLKRLLLVDVFTLALLYTMRILAGAAAVQVGVTFWILAFSMFVFLSLALAKRYVEIRGLKGGSGAEQIKERAYVVDDAVFVLAAGLTAGQLSILTLSLYLNDPAMSHRYAHPYLLWLLCPMLLYWLVRLWMKAHRGQMNDDPVVFAARDAASRVIVLASVLLVYAAS